MPFSEIRHQFPALQPGRATSSTIFFDGAAGTQVSTRVLNRMTSAMIDANANFGGLFPISRTATEAVEQTRAALVDFFHASDPREIIFGQNMTTLTFAMSRNLAKLFSPGDEIILTRMDHDANVSPWLRMAEDLSLTVKWLDFDPLTFEYCPRLLDGLLTNRTRLVAVNHASNVLGTINDVAAITRQAKSAGALVFVDSVQFAPHGVIDVKAIGCDFLVCSAYKFYGPHYGVLWGRLDLLDSLTSYKVRPAGDASPDKFETGTKSREAIAGVLGAIEHFAWIGTEWGGVTKSDSRREQIVAGLTATRNYEETLTRLLLDRLKAFPRVHVQGITSPDALHRRVPTVSFTVDGKSPAEIAAAFAARNINLWHGHNYGVEPVGRLGLLANGGVVRLSIAQYNTQEEIERFLEVFDTILTA